MDITRYAEKIRAATSPGEWQFGNSILYRMCKENPKHDNASVVSGKIWLIGRSYSAAIERVRSKKNINDDFYAKKVGPELADPELDSRLESLRGVQEMNQENINKILSTHKYLQDKIFKITEMEKRSLCSKYLHFHLPEAFFIYDSRVVSALQKLYPDRLRGDDALFGAGVDRNYAKFFYKALALRDEIKEKLGYELTPRQIDTFLINEANASQRGKGTAPVIS